jgi:hypothetical protein
MNLFRDKQVIVGAPRRDYPYEPHEYDEPQTSGGQVIGLSEYVAKHGYPPGVTPKPSNWKVIDTLPALIVGAIAAIIALCLVASVVRLMIPA